MSGEYSLRSRNIKTAFLSQMHTSTEELADISKEINPGLLVITHLLLWGKSEAELVEEVAQGYNGEFVCR